MLVLLTRTAWPPQRKARKPARAGRTRSPGRSAGGVQLNPTASALRPAYIEQVTFTAGGEAYDRFMGRYSRKLAPRFADFASVVRGQRALDVGCGPGALTAELVERLGSEAVDAIDPSASFVAAASARQPGVRVQRATAEEMPFPDGLFDATLAQLVVHFMRDPLAGLREMARVTRTGGVVAACVWDHAGDGGPLALFWAAVRELDPTADDESHLAGAREGHLGQLFRAAGLREVHDTALCVEVEHPTFDEWWEPFTLGVGPAGAYVERLDAEHVVRLREACRSRAAAAPFVVSARAWAARGLAGST
jgi:SAM-dependent methyltransferase